jgi:predicted transposase/invertase (TIGR01784 family)
VFANAPDLLAHLINAVRYDSSPITVERVLNPAISPQDISGKSVVLDILAVDTFGHRYNIEMQMRSHALWPARSVYYLSRSYANQLSRGGDYTGLRPVIGINLLNFELFPGENDAAQPLWRFGLVDLIGRRHHLADTLELHMVELPKADSLGLLEDSRLQPLRDWVALLQHCGDPVRMGEIRELPVRDALGRVHDISQDDYHRQMVEARERAAMDIGTDLKVARQEGKTEGISEGRLIAKRQFLNQLLTQRFGTLSAHLASSLHTADEPTLDRWCLAVMEANAPKDVFR